MKHFSLQLFSHGYIDEKKDFDIFKNVNIICYSLPPDDMHINII